MFLLLPATGLIIGLAPSLEHNVLGAAWVGTLHHDHPVGNWLRV